MGETRSSEQAPMIWISWPAPKGHRSHKLEETGLDPVALTIEITESAVMENAAEFTFMTMGGVALFASGAGAMRGTLLKIARIVAGLSACVFGFAHFNYIDFTASMVPSWIPPHGVFWAWATGAGHLAAGLALVSGIQSRLAATLLAGMMASFVVLLHLPRVVAAPDQHIEWIMLGVSSMLAGAAWLVRKYAA